MCGVSVMVCECDGVVCVCAGGECPVLGAVWYGAAQCVSGGRTGGEQQKEGTGHVAIQLPRPTQVTARNLRL